MLSAIVNINMGFTIYYMSGGRGFEALGWRGAYWPCGLKGSDGGRLDMVRCRIGSEKDEG